MKKRLAYFNNIPAPFSVRFLGDLRAYFDAEGWFYEKASNQRPAYWDIPLPSYCHLASGLVWRRNGRFLTWEHITWLKRFNPDVLLLSGFSIPANYLAYRWAKRKRKRVIMLTEFSRTPEGKLRGNTWHWKLMRWLYKDVDAVFGYTPDAAHQFRHVFGFGAKVMEARYGSDLDDYQAHPLRQTHAGLTILFANRLTAIYNPLAALRIFLKASQKLPGLRLLMNAAGELRQECEDFIHSQQLSNVAFLDDFKKWTDLNDMFRQADVLLLPAHFSAGNLTIYEAMSSGMGLVISDLVQGNGRVIRNGENGFRLPLDENEMAAAICQYACTPGLLATHGAINKELASSLGTKGTAQLYHELIQPFL